MLLFCMLLALTQSAMLTSSSDIHDAFSSHNITLLSTPAQFSSSIRSHIPTFVLFFHPSCPHCVHALPHFLALASLVPPCHLAAVDLSLDTAASLVSHADAFPTFKLFVEGTLVEEYTGKRRPQQMLAFLHVNVPGEMGLHLLNSTEQVDTFLEKEKEKAIVLTVFHPLHLHPLYSRFMHQLQRFPRISNVTVTFAAVNDKTLLTPPHIQRRSDDYPLVVAAPGGERFWERARFWTPREREPIDLDSFVYLMTRNMSQVLMLEERNRELVLMSRYPLLLAFTEIARAKLETGMREIVEADIVPVYVPLPEFDDLAYHVGAIRHIDDDPFVNEEDIMKTSDNLFMMWRDRVYVEQSKYWIQEMIRNVNSSNIHVRPGEIIEYQQQMHEFLFHVDPRALLIKFHSPDCPACQAFAKVYSKTARLLSPCIDDIIILSVDINQVNLTDVPEIPSFTRLPTIVWVGNGLQGELYDGSLGAWSVARWAKDLTGVKHSEWGNLTWTDVIPGYIAGVGLVLLVLGMLLGRKSKAKREHIT